VGALRGELTPEQQSQLATGEDGKKAMEVVLGTYLSSEEGITVRPDELAANV
ncbi:MAG: hypothetical protein GY733_22290, partial [bacterium]|nr:hypothetical protein [bacterium]